MSIPPDRRVPAGFDLDATAWLEVVERLMAEMVVAPQGGEVEALAQGVADGFGAAWVRIWLYDAVDDALHLRASAGFTDAPPEMRTRIPVRDPRSPVIEALLRRETVVLDAIGPESGVRWADWLIERGVRSYAGFPLVVGERYTGVMAILGYAPWSPPALATLRILARQAALAIEHARTIGQARAEARRTAALAEIASSVAVGGPLERVLDDLTQRVVATTGAQACAVFVTEAELTEARLTGMHGLPEQYARELEAAMREGKMTFTLADLDERRPIVRHNVWQTYLRQPALAHLQRFAREVDWDMTVLVPLATRGRKLGVLAGYYHHQQEPGEDELAFLSAAGNQAAIAAENARLFAGAQEKASLEERSRLARDLHDSATQTVFSIGMLAQAARRQHEHGSARRDARPRRRPLPAGARRAARVARRTPAG